jgi:hypothetical protein
VDARTVDDKAVRTRTLGRRRRRLGTTASKTVG